MKNSTTSITHAFIGATLVLLLGAPMAAAQKAPAQETPSQPAAAEPSGFLAEFLMLEQSYSTKIVQLAQAVPAEKYGWRPAEGVRSIGEALMHVATTNFRTAQSIGVPLPPGVPEDLSQVSGKEQIAELVEVSFKLIRGIAQGMAGADLSAPAPGGGGSMSMRAAILFHAQHHGEHLGQLIAYARSVGTVPPWSR